jgi:hypothetical protein
MNHYRIIFLIIYSENLEQYKEMRRMSEMYYSIFPNINYFYIQFKNDIENDIYLEHDLIFQGTESFVPGIYIKSVKALQYINQNFNYDFVIRTNLSSFWHMNNLFELLNSVPIHGYAGGYGHQGFLSGTGIIMSKDVGYTIAHSNDQSNLMDDIVISNIIQANGYSMINVTDYKWCYLIQGNHQPVDQQEFVSNGPFNPDITFSPNVLYFRIRNEPDRNIDLQYFKLLLDKIYNIDSNRIESMPKVIEPIPEFIPEPIPEFIPEPIPEFIPEPIPEFISEFIPKFINKRKNLLRLFR